MITNVYYRPHIFSPAYNPIVWSFESDKANEVDMTYVVDIYVNGQNNYAYRLKQRPNPQGVCMVDVSPIIQPYINLVNFQAEEGSTGAYFENGNLITTDFYLAVGEEYRIGTGELIIYDGTTDTAGEPAYFIFSNEGTALYAGGQLVADGPVRAFPAALSYSDGIENMADSDEYGLFKPYILGGLIPANLGYGKFLSESPREVVIGSDDHHTLTFLNWNDYAAGSYASAIQGFKVDYLSATGAPVSDFYYNQVSNGGGPSTDPAYTVLTRSRQTDLITFKCGTKDLDWGSNPIPTTYTVTATYKSTGTTGTDPGATGSETFTFNVETPCDDLYETVRLSWINSLGGRDYYNFNSFYEKSTSAKEDNYSQTLLDWSGTTPVNVGSTNNWKRGGDKSFNKIITTSFAIQSDWLTQEQIDFLGAIPESPSVWAYIGDNAIPETVTVTNLEYQYKKVKQVKLVQASFTCRINRVTKKQNY